MQCHTVITANALGLEFSAQIHIQQIDAISHFAKIHNTPKRNSFHNHS